MERRNCCWLAFSERASKVPARNCPFLSTGPGGGPWSFCQGRLGVLSGCYQFSCSHAHRLLIICCILEDIENKTLLLPLVFKLYII